ncbi:MAG TPA: tyrosine-type recombinase/integrase [Terriglobales bacterium]|nr:tyrosine-type recombinase/integrase [Terriglobales bacterium]
MALADQVGLKPSLDELRPQTRKLLALITEMVKAECERSEIAASQYRFTRRTVREYTKWCDTQLRQHLKRLEEMLETFYSSGVRRSELIRLKLYDLDRERATLTVRQGKGKKDRMIPIGERALAWVEKYLREARPQLALEPDDATLFLTQYGEPFHPDAMS